MSYIQVVDLLMQKLLMENTWLIPILILRRQAFLLDRLMLSLLFKFWLLFFLFINLTSKIEEFLGVLKLRFGRLEHAVLPRRWILMISLIIQRVHQKHLLLQLCMLYLQLLFVFSDFFEDSLLLLRR